MSLYNYVDPPNSNLICCICRTPFTDPATTTTCIHTFCKECILRAIEHSPQCPVDRSPLGPSNLVPANPIVRSLVDELLVECVHRAEGCMYTCQRQLLAAHLLDSCLYREVVCPQGKCADTILFKDALRHCHEEDKDHALDLTEDVNNDPAALAAETPVEDEPRETRLDPLNTTPPPLLSTNPSTMDGLSDAYSVPTSLPQISVLAEQNIILRHRVETLENLLHTIQREMAAVKRTLGPWYQLEGASSPFREQGFGYSPFRPTTRSQYTTSNTGSSNVEGTTTHEHQQEYTPRPSAPTSSVSIPQVDSFAAYFPSELSGDEGAVSASAPNPVIGQRVIGNAIRHQHRVSLGADPIGHDTAVLHPFSPRHPSLVAPLNLGTTLEGTLHGLRESVVGLAGSVDSMGRRHEIALSSETTRMAEEVGGLRAGIHGLRMQVHAIMMDRNAQLTGRDGLGDNLHINGQWMPLPVPQPPPPRPFYPQSSPSITKL